MQAPPLIRTERLRKSYITDAGEVPVLHGVDFTLGQGEYAALMGPSGSGKTTFMNILGCLDVASAGRYLFEGRDTSDLGGDALAHLRRDSIGFVFQSFNLLPRMSLEDNVALPLVYAGIPLAERRERAREQLDRLGLAKHTRSLPRQVSGGQQQRAAIARALINRPQLLLADEPTGNLDSHTSEEIMSIFDRLNEGGVTILLVTHESDVAAHARREVRFLDGHVVHDAASRRVRA